MPALATSTSTGPCSASTLPNAASTSSALVRRSVRRTAPRAARRSGRSRRRRRRLCELAGDGQPDAPVTAGDEDRASHSETSRFDRGRAYSATARVAPSAAPPRVTCRYLSGRDRLQRCARSIQTSPPCRCARWPTPRSQRARDLGAEHADFRLERIRRQTLRLSDAASGDRGLDADDLGFAVRVVKDGTWGFAAGIDLTPDAAARVAEQAVEVAEVASAVNREPIELAPEPSHGERDVGLLLRDRPVRGADQRQGGAAGRLEPPAAGRRAGRPRPTRRCCRSRRTSSTPTRPAP